MGRLDNIIARNRRPWRAKEKTMTTLLVGTFVLLIIALLLFTDLGIPPHDAPPPPDHHRVNGVLLWTPAPAKHD